MLGTIFLMRMCKEVHHYGFMPINGEMNNCRQHYWDKHAANGCEMDSMHLLSDEHVLLASLSEKGKLEGEGVLHGQHWLQHQSPQKVAQRPVDAAASIGPNAQNAPLLKADSQEALNATAVVSPPAPQSPPQVAAPGALGEAGPSVEEPGTLNESVAAADEPELADESMAGFVLKERAEAQAAAAEPRPRTDAGPRLPTTEQRRPLAVQGFASTELRVGVRARQAEGGASERFDPYDVEDAPTDPAEYPLAFSRGEGADGADDLPGPHGVSAESPGGPFRAP